MPRKLTDEEISRVLGMEAIVKLEHGKWADDFTGCGCVAGAAKAYAEPTSRGLSFVNFDHRWDISHAVARFTDDDLRYRAKGPDAVLRMLEKAGLA